MQILKYTCHEIDLPSGAEQEKILDDILEEFSIINPKLISSSFGKYESAHEDKDWLNLFETK